MSTSKLIRDEKKNRRSDEVIDQNQLVGVDPYIKI